MEMTSHGKLKVQIILLELTRGKRKKKLGTLSEAEMYLAARVEDAEIKLFVDTGATVTLLSKRVFDQIKESREDITDEESNQEIMAAEGNLLRFIG